MKYLIVIILIASSIFSNAQLVIDSVIGKYSISEVIQTDLNSHELYTLGKEWFALNFKSANAVVQLDVKDEKIIGKGVSTIHIIHEISKISIPLTIDLVVTLDFKDLKYRYKVECNSYHYTPVSMEEEAAPLEESYRKSLDSALKASGVGSLMYGKKARDADAKQYVLDYYNSNSQKRKLIVSDVSSTANSIKKHLVKKKDDFF